MIVRVWDPVNQQLKEKRFISWGVFREAEYKVIRKDKFFKLAGPCVVTTGTGKHTDDVVIDVLDASHFTWTVKPRTASKPPMFEEYTRLGSDPIEPPAPPVKDEAAQLKEQVASAQSLRRAQKWSAAIKLLEQTIAQQKKLLGEEHADVAASVSTLSGFYRGWVINLIGGPGASPDERKRALKLATTARTLAPDNPNDQLVAMAKYRIGDFAGAMTELHKSLSDPQQMWAGQWFIAAIIRDALGKTEEARDWYAAGCIWMQNHSPTSQDNIAVRDEAATVVNLPRKFPGSTWKRAQYVDLFTRLITKYPQVANLYHARASQYGRLRKWDKAIADYTRAAKLDPKFLRHLEAQAAVCLQVGDPEQLQAVCDQCVTETADIPNVFSRDNAVLMCSLTPTIKVDRKRLAHLAEEALAERASNPFLRLVRGAALYRCGDFEAALDILPTADATYDNIKDTLLAQLFLSMTRCQLGDKYTAQKLLTVARAAVKRELASPDGPETPYQDRPVSWCRVHRTLREAETLIGASSK